MTKAALLAIIGVAALSLLGLMYLAVTWEAPRGSTTMSIDPPAPAQPEAESATSFADDTDSVLPRIRIQPRPQPAPPAADPTLAEPPVEVPEQPSPAPVTAPPDQTTVQLPDLNASDGFVVRELRGLNNGAALVRLLVDDQIVRKFVVLVENISRGTFPQTGLPYRALGQEMPVRSMDENLFVMDETAAHSRFDGVINTFVAMDTDSSMALYRTLSPLFQEAYAEIGFRDTSFDQALQRAITKVLAMPEVAGPYQLVKPSVMYLYADASTENLPEVHKQLIRIGPQHTRQLKAKLREFLDRLQP